MKKSIGWSMTSIMTAVALFGLAFTAVPAYAVVILPADPSGCSSNGVGISITVFRADGTTNIGPTQRVKDGEVIKYRSTLSFLGGTNCAFEGGTWTLTTPDGTVNNLGAVPEIGGAGVASLDSALVPYTVNHANEVSKIITATTAYAGFSRDGNNSPASASTGISKTVAHAKISITPTATNEVTKVHTFTAHVDVDPGSGFVNADDGTVISFALSGVGGLSSATCNTAGGTGSCTVTDTSSVPGVDTVNASANVTQSGGVPFGTAIAITTDGLNGDSGPAVKTWVDANIQISPLTATDPINDNHVLTATVHVNTGTGGYVLAPDGTVISLTIVSGPGSFTTTNPCTTAGGTGSCSVTLTSPTIGTTVINASTTPNIGGVQVHRETADGKGTDSANAQKTWINNIASMTTAIHSGATDSGAPVVVTTVPAGSTVHDSATLTFNGPVPTGNVNFEFYTGPGVSACAEGTPVSAGSAAINGSGIADPSSSEGPLAAGQYYFEAHWAGDSNYPNGATSACEPLTVTKVTPTLTTTPNPTSGDVGVVLNDSATLSGAVNPTGSITFNLYPPADATCSATASYTQVVALTGNSAATSPGFTSNAAGVWHWTADYPGDGNNNAASSGCQAEPVTVNQPQVATRTLGFWQTHTAFTESIFNGKSGGSVILGGMVIDTNGKLFAGFLASIPKTTTGAKRSALDRARMQLAQQWLATELNCEAFTCPANIQSLLTQASTDFSSGTASQILTDAGLLDTYNNSGDSIPSNLSQGPATPKASKAIADYAFWDVLN